MNVKGLAQVEHLDGVSYRYLLSIYYPILIFGICYYQPPPNSVMGCGYQCTQIPRDLAKNWFLTWQVRGGV